MYCHISIYRLAGCVLKCGECVRNVSCQSFVVACFCDKVCVRFDVEC